MTQEETEALELLRTSGYPAVAETLLRLLKQKWAETKALNWVKASGYKNIQQLDWLGYKDGKWVIFEAKGKELFTPGPNYNHWGAGLAESQVWLRTQLLNDLGWRTYLINFVPETDKVYGAYLDELEKKGSYWDTSGIRIYPLENYEAIHTLNQN